jgi:hypothetical protein
MSVNHNMSVDGDKAGLEQSTFALTISSISLQEGQEHYDEEFTLNPLIAPRQRTHCLAYQVALTFPPRIRQEVTRMVDYYEDTLEKQAREYHRIVEENHRLKKENNCLRANHLANEFKLQCGRQDKENLSPFRKTKDHQQQQRQEEHSPLANKRLNARIGELETLVLDKDRKINELNGEVSDLMLKVRRYKRKAEESHA